MRSFGSISCLVHAFWVSQNTQSTTCARNLDKAEAENVCFISPATLPFLSFSGPFPPAWESKPEQQQRWEVMVNPSRIFKLALPASLSSSTSEPVSELSSCSWQCSAQKETCLNIMLHGMLQYSSR